MPRKTPLPTKIRWTEKAESGMTAAEIRSEESPRPDLRTVEKAIAEVRAERQRRHAREIALREGLREHWRILLDALGSIPLQPDDVRSFDKRPYVSVGARKLGGTGWSAARAEGVWKVTFHFDRMVESELLREHLRGDPLWRRLDAYRSGLEEFIGARLEFAKGVAAPLRSALMSAGLIRNADQEDGQSPLDGAGLARFDEAVAAAACSDSGDERPATECRCDGGAIRVADSLLVAPGAVIFRGDSEECKRTCNKALGEASRSMQKTEHWRRLLVAAAALESRRAAMAREVKVLRISTVLPGECASCARYSA